MFKKINENQIPEEIKRKIDQVIRHWGLLIK